MMKQLRIGLLACVLLALAACGSKGDLTLPKEPPADAASAAE